MSPFGLYIHIPFCPQLCPYCAFASVQGGEELYERYVQAACGEIESWAHLAARGPLATVFLGGGTPSRLAPEQLGRLLEAADQHLGIGQGAEITVEVNPGTVDGEKFALLRQMGTNRLSIGVQSFCDRGLRLLGRVHSAAEAERAYARAREAGFANVSLDLIFSVPGLPEEDWRYSVERAVDLGPEHVSAYALTIEEGTPFARRQRQGRLSPLSEEEDLRQYEWAVERLSQAGYEQYEVSNFARPGYRSRHNWGYWTGAEYLGVGMSAHSFIDGVRFWNTRDLGGYLQAMEQGHSPRQAQEAIDQDTARRERWWLGLRTDQGIVLSVEERACLAGESRFADLRKAGYVRLEGDRLRLTRPGLALADGLGVELTTILERSPKPQRKPAAA